MSKILRFEASNVKRLRAVEIVPEGNVIKVGGANGQGKTSVLDSIAMALGGGKEIPQMPVRNGEEKAYVILETEQYTIKRTFTAAGGGSIIVANKEGARYPAPQKILDELAGKLTFDPMAFLRLDPKPQAEQLRKMVGIDLSSLDSKRCTYYDERTTVNAMVVRLQAKAEAMPFNFGAPDTPIDPAALMSKLEQINTHNSKIEALKQGRDSAREKLSEETQYNEYIRKQVADLERKLTASREALAGSDATLVRLKSDMDAAVTAHDSFVPQDVSEVRKQISEVNDTNKAVAENAARSRAYDEVKREKAKADDLTAKIEAVDAEKNRLLREAKFPINGLSFNADGITYNGVPLCQASGAEQLRVSVAISAALNPKMRVMMVRDGSLLDEKSQALLADIAQQNDLQLWLEVVTTDAGKCSVLIEDGSVVTPSKI